jgi:aryl-alcohol dehydrogenase-like predicted oxidoreductase
MLPRRPLGRTGLLVAPLGLGTVKLGRNTGVRYPGTFALPDDRAVAELLDRALALGVNLVDTAPAYGASEVRLRPFLEKHRKEVVLCTKCGERHEGGVSSWDFSGKGLRASAEASLKRLGVEAVDLLLLHSDGRDVELLEKGDALATLQSLKREGKTRAIGLSAKTDAGVRAAAGKGLDVVMAPFNRADTLLAPALDAVHASGLGVLGIKAVQQGHAGDPDAAVAFAVSRPFIDCVVLGTLNPAHLASAAAAAERALEGPR